MSFYPPKPRELDKRRKLSEDDIKEIRRLHAAGRSYRSLAVDYGVNKTTITYHCDAEYRQKHNKETRANRAAVLLIDENARIRQRLMSLISMRERRALATDLKKRRIRAFTAAEKRILEERGKDESDL